MRTHWRKPRHHTRRLRSSLAKLCPWQRAPTAAQGAESALRGFGFCGCEVWEISHVSSFPFFIPPVTAVLELPTPVFSRCSDPWAARACSASSTSSAWTINSYPMQAVVWKKAGEGKKNTARLLPSLENLPRTKPANCLHDVVAFDAY